MKSVSLKEISLKGFAAKAALVFLLATFLGLFFATQTYLTYLYRDGRGDFLASASVTLPSWYVWAIFTPLIVWLAKRFPFEKQKWFRNILIHLGLGLVISVAKLLFTFQLTALLSWLPSLPVSIYQFHPTFLTYWVIVGLSHAIDYYRKLKERELRNSQLQTRLAQAQLQVLKMQLQPHFLFNTLHAISTLMHKDVEKADRMMARLSDLLRLTLDNVGVQEVRLKQELEFLEGYLDIETTRFQNRLTIETHIDPETLDARVPNLILQPLVENAIRHGIEPRSAPGKIEILTERKNGKLTIQISDDGPGFKRKDISEGIGLKNTKARLQQLYGQDFEFNIQNSKPSGLVVKLHIPFRLENSSANGENQNNHR